MPRVEFELTIPASERVKTFHALDRSATVIGPRYYISDTIRWYRSTSAGRSVKTMMMVM
jgi:hypothetical protein